MATGDKYTNVYSKKFLSWQEFATYIIGYLRELIGQVLSWVWPGDNSWFATSVTLGSDVADQIDVGDFDGIDEDGKILRQPTPRSGYEKDVPFENATAIDYHIGVHYFEVPDEAELAARSGQAEYRYFREDIGEVAHPDSVTDNGDGTMTLVVNSVAEARDNTSRYVYVWLVDPQSAVDWIEEKQIVWNSGASENRITTTAKLGQDTISTDPNDYWVALRGISVKRDTDLRTDKSYVYVGKATGNSGSIPTFSTTDQKIVGAFIQEVIDARTSSVYGTKASLGLRIEEVDGEVNTARDGKTTLQDRLEGEAEFNIIIDTADKGDYISLATYIGSAVAGDRVLINVDEEITGSTMVIPANITLKQQKGKKLWCDENLTTVLQFGSGVVTEGDFLLEFSHTGTVTTAVSFNGDDNNHCNIIVKNTSTGWIINMFKLESGAESNFANTLIKNTGGGTISNELVNNSGEVSNLIIIKRPDFRPLISSVDLDINWIHASVIGSGLTISGIAAPCLTALNDTDVAFLDSSLESLRTYRFNGSTWSLVGSGLSISGVTTPAITALNGTDIALLDGGLESLRTYRFNGSTWSLVGSGLSISGITTPALTALNDTDVAFLDSSLESLRTYRFNGSTWSLVGSGLSISGITTPSLATLNGTDIAFIDGDLESLRTYRFNGSTWSLVGSGLSISGIASPDLAGLNGTDVAFLDNTLDELRTYRFNGSTWSQVGSGLSISGITNPTITALNGIDVAFLDSAVEDLTKYRFAFYLGRGPYMP